MKIVIHKSGEEFYNSLSGDYCIAREWNVEVAPGFKTYGHWVLRKGGNLVDWDSYFNDLTERNNIKVVE